MSERRAHLSKVVDLSLDVLRKRDEMRDFASFFPALCVLQTQQSIPTRVLQKLRNLDGLDDSDKILSASSGVA